MSDAQATVSKGDRSRAAGHAMRTRPTVNGVPRTNAHPETQSSPAVPSSSWSMSPVSAQQDRRLHSTTLLVPIGGCSYGWRQHRKVDIFDTPRGLKPDGFSVHRRSQRRDSPKGLPGPLNASALLQERAGDSEAVEEERLIKRLSL